MLEKTIASLLHLFSLYHLCLLGAGLLSVYIAWELIIKPCTLLNFYRKQGISTIYFPIVGAILRLYREMKEHGDFAYSLKRIVNETPKPKALGINIVNYVSIFLFDPILIKEFYMKHEYYIKNPKMASLHKLLLGEGLLLSEGKSWKRHKKYVSMAFHYELLRGMIPDAVKISEELLDKIKHKDLNSIAIMHEYQAITAEVIGRIFFGERFSEYTIDDIPATVFLANSLSKIGREMLSPSTVALGVKFAQLGILKRHREMLKYIKKSREFCQKIVTQRMNEIDIERKKGYMPERQTLMDIFYNQRIEKPEDSFSDIEIVDEFITFFVTGMDTTGHLIAMASYYLLQHPQYKDRLLKEADHYFSDPSKVTIDTLTQMEFMGAFLKEALRMGTPTPFVFERIAIADHKLGDLDIKKGTAINTCFIANNFDETLHQDPNSFNPDRWITSSKTQETMAKNPFAFTPFSIGARNCIGQHLAMNEARIIFSLFLKKYNYELADKNYKLRMTFRAFYEPEDELIYRLTSNST